MSSNWNFNDAEASRQVLEKLRILLGRHLISLGFTLQTLDNAGNPEGDPRFAAVSGLAMSFRDNWFFLTAGHAIEELRDKRIQIVNCTLNDFFGPDAASNIPIPFDYVNAPKFDILDEDAGIDFGLVGIHPHFRRLLEANGVLPLCEEAWANMKDQEFDRHLLLGIPMELTTSELVENSEGRYLKVSVSPTLVPLDELPEPPPGARKTTLERFVARAHDICDLGSVEGMSGGPIFAFPKGVWNRYWIIAIQSMWMAKSRTVLGFPVQFMIDLMERALSEYLDGHQAERNEEEA